MSRAEAIEQLLSSTMRLVERAAAEPRVLQTVIVNLRRATNAQEVDAMHTALADLLAGMSGLLEE